MDAEKTYDSFSIFYDAYVGGFQDDLPLYLEICDGKTDILEVGCGTGRVLNALLQKGFSVTGLDISSAMLSIAESKLSKHITAGKLKLMNHNLISSPLSETYFVVLATFYTVNYLLNEPDLYDFLRHIHDSMQNDGVIVLDCFYPKAMSRPDANDKWERSVLHDGRETMEITQKKKMLNNIEERIQVFQKGADRREVVTHRMYYDKTAMIKMLARVGFEKIQIADDYAHSSFHEPGPEEHTKFELRREGEKR